MTHMLLCHGGVMSSKAMDNKALHWGTYWAALTHDYDHRGFNNDFLIKTAHPLAITYSDHSPLEYHHVSAATKVLLEPECQYITVSHPSHSFKHLPIHSSAHALVCAGVHLYVHAGRI